MCSGIWRCMTSRSWTMCCPHNRARYVRPVSIMFPVKMRRTLIGGSRNMIVYDDLEPSEKIKVYDRGIAINNNTENLYQMLIGYRTGDMWSPQVDTTEALRIEA